ncbi:orotate phosphoribosyltransferase [Candidatus Gottesmanbacteria bacterium]|nr:orotate phosphoribosyltransferase [Candidatus Gottesmanbacteria bacterium]
MTGDEVLAIFKKTGGYITGSHIVYTSGKHGEVYLNKDAIYPHTKEISAICLEIAKKFKDKGIEVVSAPALGGIILSQWTAYHLSLLTNREVLGVYTEKTSDKNQIFTRGYDKLVQGKRVLVVEDVTTTGGSVKKVIESVRKAKGQVVAVCVLVNRDSDNINSKTIGALFYPLAEVKMQAWEEKDCPLCQKNVPINTTVGKGREYLEKKKLED